MKNQNCACRIALLTAGIFILVQAVHAEEGNAADSSTNAASAISTNQAAADQSYLNEVLSRDKLTGDWRGLRPDLSKHGIDIDLRLSQYYQAVTSGGRDENDEYGGTMDYRFNFDTHKLLGTWEGLSVNMHARTRWGDDVNAEAGNLVLQNTAMLMPAPGDYEDTDITGLLVNQMLDVNESHLGLLSVGLIDILDAVTLFFPSVGYGQEGFMNVNTMVSALPWFGAVQGLSLYGGWFATINKQHGIGQSAILVTGTENESTRMGSVSDAFDDVWVAAFHRFIWDADGKMGYFMVFAGASTKEQASNDDSDIIDIPGVGIENTDTEKPWDIALYLYQDFWQDVKNPARKANFMIGGTVGPDNPQFAQYNFFANVEAYGLLTSRPNDRMGAGGWYHWLSSSYKGLVPNLQNLYGFEFYYNYALTPAMHLTANLQLVENEWKDDDFAVIPGLRLVVDF